MNTSRSVVWASLLSLGLAGCATQKEEPPQAWGGTVIGQYHKKAVVQHVNYSRREVTVKDEAGEVSTVVAGPLVRNFNQINEGDRVALQYQESVTLLAMKGVEAVPARADSVDVVGAPLGEKPSGVIVRQGEVIAEVLDVNQKDRTVTVRGPVRTLAVKVDKRDKNFKHLQPGDRVYVRSTSALAIAVTAE